jgi:hypothetical protein
LAHSDPRQYSCQAKKDIILSLHTRKLEGGTCQDEERKVQDKCSSSWGIKSYSEIEQSNIQPSEFQSENSSKKKALHK